MSTSAASLSGAAGRYASAIFELARDSNALDSIDGEFQSLRSLIDENGELAGMIASPAFSREDQAKAMGAVQDRLGHSPLARNFVQLMTSKGRLAFLPEAMTGFSTLLAAHRGQETAEVISAKPLSDTQREALRNNLQQAYDKDVRIDESVDPSLLGGLIVKIGSKMVDGSLKSKLERLELAMKAH